MTRIALTTIAISALVVGSAFAAQSTNARGLFEQAAYAEHQRHDLLAAERGYEDALKAAETAQDTPVIAEAKAALARLRQRAGPAAGQRGEVPEGAIKILQLAAAESNNAARAADLALYGDVLVPILEQMVAEPSGALIHTPSGSWLNQPLLAAATLARIGSPQARVVLAGALTSPDPLLRRHVVSLLGDEDVELLLVAANDAIPTIRDRAIQRLESIDDVRAKPMMLARARTGAAGGVGWLWRNAPMELIPLVMKGHIPGVEPKDLNFRHFPVPRIDGDLEMLAEFSVQAAPANVRAAAVRLASELLIHGSPPSEADFLRLCDITLKYRTTWSLELVGLGDPTRAVATLRQFVRDTPDKLDKDLDVALASALEARLATPQTLAELVNLALELQDKTDIETPAPHALHDAVAIALMAPSVGHAEARRDRIRLFLGLRPWVQVTHVDDLRRWINSEARGDTAAVSPPLLAADFAALVRPLLELERSKATSQALEVVAMLPEPLKLADLLAFAAEFEQVPERARLPVQRSAVGEPASVARAFSSYFVLVPDNTAATERAVRVARLVAEIPETMRVATLRAALELELAPETATQLVLSGLAPLDAQQGPTAEMLDLTLALAMQMPATESEARLRLVDAIRSTLHEPGVPFLGEALRSKQPQVRQAAQAAFAALRTQREALEEFEVWLALTKEQRSTTQELIELLESRKRDVVLGAVSSLGAIKATGALPALVRLLEQDDAELKRAVRDAIARIGGQ